MQRATRQQLTIGARRGGALQGQRNQENANLRPQREHPGRPPRVQHRAHPRRPQRGPPLPPIRRHPMGRNQRPPLLSGHQNPLHRSRQRNRPRQIRHAKIRPSPPSRHEQHPQSPHEIPTTKPNQGLDGDVFRRVEGHLPAVEIRLQRRQFHASGGEVPCLDRIPASSEHIPLLCPHRKPLPSEARLRFVYCSRS